MRHARRAAERSGHRAEALAALWLAVKGYRILARRFRTPVGEVDLIAARRHRLAFIEVKRRASLDDAARALTPRQHARVARAAEYWLARRPAFQEHDVGFDVILIAPWSRPRHLRDAFRI
jgi:putative endonuclease